jgi:hypothetical protein
LALESSILRLECAGAGLNLHFGKVAPDLALGLRLVKADFSL